MEPDGGGSLYKQRAIFFPRGLAGRLYWLGVYPFHGIIFPSMARNISAAASALQEAQQEAAPNEREQQAGSGVASDTP